MIAIPHELALLKIIRQDKGLSPFHISLFTAMIVLWQEQNYACPFQVTRCKLMAASGIRSPATYHKCLKLLVNRNYIIYEPSFHPGKGSLIYWPDDRVDKVCFQRTISE
jgi:hypothetical protein